MIVVSDTSPITALLKIGKVDLLHRLYGEVLIPEAVRDELSLSHQSLPVFFQCAPVVNHRAVEKLLEELDAGEAEAIVLAKEKHADVLLIDEIEGRDVAAREGLHFIGLLGVLDQAKLNGFIPSIREVLGEIESQTTFYISEEIKNLALQRAGEL
jgi:predicted nucleic acid-binding protein